MRKRVHLLIALMVVCLNTVKTQEIEDNVVELDLNTDTVTSTQGVDVKYGNIKMKAFDLKREKEKNKAYIKGKMFVEADDPMGKVEIESYNGEVSLDGDTAEFGKSIGSIEVGLMTGAEYPNDKIYFGGDSLYYSNGNVLVKKGWATTDPSIVQKRDPNLTGYHLLSNSMYIEPDKQITFKETDLFIGKTDIIPYTLPWYRINIRQGSQVPLFPSFGTEDEYGFNLSWGYLYGDRESKYKGGFAPKFAEYQGFLIGRWENWYETEKYGTAKLDMNDVLVYKKNDGADDRWDINYTHDYEGEYGTFKMDLRNSTYNMVPSLNDLIDDYEDEGRFNKDNWNYVGMPKPYKGKAMTFLTLDSDLQGLGENKDISFKAKTKLVDDRDAYKLIVDDAIDDEVEDYSLFADVALYKDNERYRIGGYYNYFYDPAPGSTPNSLKSKAENFGAEVVDKQNKLNLKYDEKNEDKYRRLGFWESNLNLNRRWLGTATTLLGDYDLYTIPEYNVYDSKNLDISAGDYRLVGDLKYKVGFNYNTSEKELSLLLDPFRKNNINGNERDKQFNRYQNIIYDDRKEESGYLQLSYENVKFTFSGGNAKEEFWDRQGLYNYVEEGEGLSYRKYVNESNFVEGLLEGDSFYLGKFGELDLFGGLRYDDYTKGYNPYTQQHSKGSDSSIRTQVGGTYRTEISDRFDNVFSYKYQKYNYDSGDVNFGSEYNPKDIRMKNKYNTQQFKDTVNLQLWNTEINYTVDYEEKKRATNDNKAYEIFKNEISISPEEKIVLKFNYDQNKRYDDETESGDNYNDLTFKNYGTSLTYGNNRFYYKRNAIDAEVWDMKTVVLPVDDSFEKIREDEYGYSFTKGLNVLTLTYKEATDKRYNYTVGEQELDVNNKQYGISYLVGGEIEHRYAGTYEINDSDENKALLSDEVYLRYDYKDKRLNERDLMIYARKEFDKSSNDLTQEELDRVKQIVLNRRNSSSKLGFDLRKNIDRRIGIGDYRESLSTSISLQRNKERYEQTGNYLDSLQEVEGKLYYSRNRVGLGYEYVQTSGYSGKGWRDFERDHQLSFHAKIGKPSEGWRVKTYVQFYDGLKGTPDIEKRKKLDGLGIELGKEMGYYEWSVAFLKEYSYSKKDYEWQAALQFKLLTFPDRNIFGLGVDRSPGKDSSLKPEVYLFDGLKVKDDIEED